uniref:Protection of telomeres protein 1 n=1 Tax=Sphaeramia orbicularis TaxID=375764 RepID=A0A673B528_9TELE
MYKVSLNGGCISSLLVFSDTSVHSSCCDVVYRALDVSETCTGTVNTPGIIRLSPASHCVFGLKGPYLSLRALSLILDSSSSSCLSRVFLQDVVLASGFAVSKSPTVNKDKLHPCNLLLSGDDACIYVSVSRTKKAPKYTYVRLDDLKPNTTVNVYGVVVFFKQPYMSRGTDFCSNMKITDQSNQKIVCNIFLEKLDDHPKIFQIGDIVRMHRVKVKLHEGSLTLVKTFGFSVVTFDGTEGKPVEPRTSSRSFHFDQDDHRTVEELRSWAATQALLPPTPVIPLSAAQPKSYFDLTCQLLAKAPVDSTCFLLRVWDGTRSPHTLNVIVDPNATEGPSSFSPERERLIANVLVYDNHVEYARHLKIGDFLRIYNLRAIPGSSKVSDITSSESDQVDQLAFHLHGGTTYGRGIRVLPENSPDVQKLKRYGRRCGQKQVREPECRKCHHTVVWLSPLDDFNHRHIRSEMFFWAERTCSHDVQTLTLAEVKRSDPGQVHHVRVQLRSYEPQKLHQALKLYCSKCSSMYVDDIPDDDLLTGVFSEASVDSGPCSPPQWALSGQVDLPADSPGSTIRPLTVHLSTQLLSEGKTRQLLFLMGATLEEVKSLSFGYLTIVPVRSSGGHLTLLDLSAPFLFRGRRRYYGCKRCSKAVMREPSAEGVEVVNEKIIAEALGVQLLQFVLLMKLKLQDDTDTLDVLLWRDAELFFNVLAEDVAVNQEAQNIVCQTMDSLCPLGGSIGKSAHHPNTERLPLSGISKA